MAHHEDLIKCYNCGKKLLVERVIDNKVVKMFSPERTQTEFFISNNSRMPVSVCLDCYNLDLTDPTIQANIMNNVIDGWQQEQNMLIANSPVQQVAQFSSDMIQAQTSNVMDSLSALTILFKSEGLSDDQIRSRI